MRHLVAVSKLARDGRKLPAAKELAKILVDTAADESLEPAFRAQALALPAESDIAREIGSNIDPDAIHTAREAVLAEIASAGLAVFTKLAESAPTGPYSPASTDAGLRALAGAAMAYASIAERDPARAKAAYDASNNMTEITQALQVLTHRFPGSSETAEALAAFGSRFAGDPLALDKWYSIQAMAPGAKTCDRVETLLNSPEFDRTNPNRMRALIGSFSAGNPTGFNVPDGAGYRLLAREVIDIDARNPQLAARLLTTMRSWRSFEAGRQELARQALVSVREAGKLSPDVGDIIDRMLAN